ncbi:hypothetical protein [Paracoccus benzoatiresistens]|uniref:Uncharacterized protein n=1 Tax=Paracoccus benzoatiresistens TaxID=2997341 RepID=A0ABT4J9F3_9RHOB|nr:hypothetical protein [Paracoccus sp. EF6]MCZ0963718.1 hypothetical protein [Paracoccus sp. EF6]
MRSHVALGHEPLEHADVHGDGHELSEVREAELGLLMLIRMLMEASYFPSPHSKACRRTAMVDNSMKGRMLPVAEDQCQAATHPLRQLARAGATVVGLAFSMKRAMEGWFLKP